MYMQIFGGGNTVARGKTAQHLSTHRLLWVDVTQIRMSSKFDIIIRPKSINQIL